MNLSRCPKKLISVSALGSRFRQIARRYALHFEPVMFLAIVLVILLAGDGRTGNAQTENSTSFLRARGLLVAESKGDSSARSRPLPQQPSAVDAARHQDEPLKSIRLTRSHKAPRARAKLVYTVTYEPAIQSRLLISLRGTGLRASAGGLVCELPDWGEWASATFPYLRNLRIDGHQLKLRSDGTIPVPRAFLVDGELRVSYEILVYPLASVEHQQRRFLPYHSRDHVFAFVQNTLVRLRVAGASLDVTKIVHVGKTNDTVFTGWAGLGSGPQAGELAADDGIYALGRPIRHTVVNAGGARVEVAQYADATDATRAITDIATALLPTYERATGQKSSGVVRFVVDESSSEEIDNGTTTGAGIVLTLSKAAMRILAETGQLPDSIKRLIAHELFHCWLGAELREDGSLVWFSEGFTEYISLKHSAAVGVISPARFAELMLEIERLARAQAAHGRPAFADLNVNWREDGNETLAYRAGALLAFLVDVRLRERSHKTVAEIVRALFRGESRKYQLPQIRDAMTTLGLQDVYKEFVEGRDLPAARSLLTAIGYDEVMEPAALTYLGIEARFTGPSSTDDVVPAVVVDVDPKGPGSKAGILPGDTIVGYGSRRVNPPELSSNAPERYRFGLNMIPSGAKSVPLDVLRNGEKLQVTVVPVRIPGGQRMSLRWNPERGKGFFEV